jgi:uncharacterized protein with LGFP repeats
MNLVNLDWNSIKLAYHASALVSHSWLTYQQFSRPPYIIEIRFVYKLKLSLKWIWTSSLYQGIGTLYNETAS